MHTPHQDIRLDAISFRTSIMNKEGGYALPREIRRTAVRSEVPRSDNDECSHCSSGDTRDGSTFRNAQGVGSGLSSRFCTQVPA